MSSQLEIIWFQLAMLLIAVLARSSYFALVSTIPRLQRRHPEGAWSEVTRIGSDLCMMSFATIATAMLNSQSLLAGFVKAEPFYMFKYFVAFLVIYIVTYGIHKFVGARNPFSPLTFRSLGSLSVVAISWLIGYFVLGAACGLAVTSSN